MRKIFFYFMLSSFLFVFSIKAVHSQWFQDETYRRINIYNNLNKHELDYDHVKKTFIIRYVYYYPQSGHSIFGIDSLAGMVKQVHKWKNSENAKERELADIHLEKFQIIFSAYNTIEVYPEKNIVKVRISKIDNEGKSRDMYYAVKDLKYKLHNAIYIYNQLFNDNLYQVNSELNENVVRADKIVHKAEYDKEIYETNIFIILFLAFIAVVVVGCLLAALAVISA